MLLGFFALAVLHLLLNLVGKKIPKVHRASSKISTFLYWNGIIRFFIESYLDFAVCALINLKEINWEDDLSAVYYNNVLTFLTVVCLGLIPIILVVFYIYKLKMWNDEEFKAKYSSLIEGTK